MTYAQLPPESCRFIEYDIETFPNCFQFGWADHDSDAYGLFELSDRRDDSAAFFAFLAECYRRRIVFIGFNNLFFDYPVIHELMLRPEEASAAVAYAAAQRIIDSQNGNKWSNIVWADQRFIQQIDLFAMNHFDNVAKTTSLKALQFAIRAESIEELPIEPGTVLTAEQMEVNAKYCLHDVTETKRFAHLCKAELDLRQALVPEFGTEVLNWADGKIGRQKIIRALGDEACFTKKRGQRRQPRGTPRDEIVVADIVFPYIQFQHPECRKVLQAFQESKIDAAKPGALSNSCEIDGFRFDFGVGGIHGSVDRQIIRADADHLIIDIDVASFYPSTEIENGMYPEHLGPRFVDVLRGIRDERLAEKFKPNPDKGRVQMLKYALNVPYGDSNNPYSPLFDPQYTMQTTINGQLMLLMLAERLLALPGVRVLQANTDGITIRTPKTQQHGVADVCAEWERLTRLVLEYKLYDLMCVRDVNNYLARDTHGKIKRKGAYDYPETWADYSGWWFRDYSYLVVAKAAQAALCDRHDVSEFIYLHDDPYDFMIRAKTPKSSVLTMDPGGPWEAPLPRITRYFAAKDGFPFKKLSPPCTCGAPAGSHERGCGERYKMPGHFKRRNGVDDATFWKVYRDLPTETADGLTRPVHSPEIHTKNKSVYEDRTISVHPNALPCLDMRTFKWSDLDREWYVQEARKLVDCFRAP